MIFPSDRTSRTVAVERQHPVCSGAMRTPDVEELRAVDFERSEVSATAHYEQNFASAHSDARQTSP
jgi:hypothetical protein